MKYFMHIWLGFYCCCLASTARSGTVEFAFRDALEKHAPTMVWAKSHGPINWVREWGIFHTRLLNDGEFVSHMDDRGTNFSKIEVDFILKQKMLRITGENIDEASAPRLERYYRDYVNLHRLRIIAEAMKEYAECSPEEKSHVAEEMFEQFALLSIDWGKLYSFRLVEESKGKGGSQKD